MGVSVSQGAMRIVLLAVIYSAAGGCERSSPGASAPVYGCVLGYSSEGVFVIDLHTGAKQCIIAARAGELWTNPVWSPWDEAVYCIAAKKDQAVQVLPGASHPKVVYSAPQGTEIRQLAITEEFLVILLVDRDDLMNKELILVELESGSSRTLAVANFDTGQPLELMPDDSVLTAVLRRDGSQWRHDVVKVPVDGAKRETLLTLPDRGCFRLSPDGDTLFIVFDEGKMQMSSLSSGRVTSIKLVGLPGGTSAGSPFCFCEEQQVLIWREKDAMAPLGTYWVNLSSGKSERVLEEMVHAMTYFRR